MGSFENIRQAMLIDGPPAQPMNDTDPVEAAPANASNPATQLNVNRIIVLQVVQVLQECLQLKNLKRANPSFAMSPNITRMLQWCESMSSKWFAQYYYHHWVTSPEYRTITEVNRYLLPTVISISLTTTLLAFFVLWRIDSKQKRAAWYFLFTINNCILLKVLIDTLPRYTARRFGTMDIYRTVIGCKLLTFFVNVLQYAPGWILAVALIDQVSAIRRARSENRQNLDEEREGRLPTLSYFAAKATVICILVGLGVINVHTLWLYNTRLDSGEGDGGGGGGNGGNGGSMGYSGAGGQNATTAPPKARGSQERRGRCQMTPSGEPRIFTFGYPLFLFTMHSVVPLLVLLGTFAAHLATCCSRCASNSPETRMVVLSAIFYVLCDLPAAGMWFYFQLGMSPERTYQIFKIWYSINFSIQSWIFLKCVFFVPVLFCASAEFRGGTLYLVRYLGTAIARRGSCRRSREASTSCTGRRFQCICECTAPTCEAQPTELCAQRCLCFRCRWPVLDSIEYTRGYTISQPKRRPPGKASIEADEDSTDIDATSSPRMSTYKTDAVLTRLALPVLCDCACLYQDPWRSSPSFAEHDEDDSEPKPAKNGEERTRTKQPSSMKDTDALSM